MRPDDIYLASFPFGDAPGMKLRPVLLLTGPLGSVPEVLVAYISSVIPPVLLATDIVLDPGGVESSQAGDDPCAQRGSSDGHDFGGNKIGRGSEAPGALQSVSVRKCRNSIPFPASWGPPLGRW
jgi:hypothetical protein